MRRKEDCLEMNPREMALTEPKQGTHCEEWQEEVCVMSRLMVGGGGGVVMEHLVQ